MRKLTLSIVLFATLYCYTQELYFHFDTDLLEWNQSSDVRWSIDTVNPIKGNASLHHSYDNPIGDYDVIAHSHKPLLLDSSLTSWEFSIRYAYTPSSGNNWSVWLTSNKGVSEMCPTGTADGYILGVNYTGNDDLIKLWKQEDGTKTIVFESNFNWQNDVNLDDIIQVKATRSINGLWKIYAGKESPLTFLGEQTDITFQTSSSTGIYYEYTSSQDMKLWIDEYRINGLFYDDLTPPELKRHNVEKNNQLNLVFSEAIDTNLKPIFNINNSLPLSHCWHNENEITLYLKQPFEEQNTLRIQNLTDLSGNVTKEIVLTFEHYLPQKFEVLINELMVDPTPVLGLPDCEYIELFNNTNHTIDIEGWSIRSGDREPCILSEYLFEAGSYLLLVEEKYVEEFPVDIHILNVNQLPTLPNTGEDITLKDASGKLIHSAEYDYSTYKDDNKKEGGWSLELIDVHYPCLKMVNWLASTDKLGGTPGKPNAVMGTLSPYPQTYLKEIHSITPEFCQLSFSQSLDSLTVIEPVNYLFNNQSNSISHCIYLNNSVPIIQIYFEQALEFGANYTLQLTENIKDCAGVAIRDEIIDIGLAQSADSSDVLINEILFESTEEKPEFIELVNNSKKVIELDKLWICAFDSYFDTIKTTKPITEKKQLLFPGEFVILTQNRKLLIDTYSLTETKNVIEPPSWLNLSNDGGIIGLTTDNSELIEKVAFSNDMHFPLLQNKEGVSLERVSLYEAGTETGNWRSASSGVDFASPLQANSQANNEDSDFSYFQFSSDKISPDNDGLDDYLDINYSFEKSEFVTDIKIFSQHGKLVCHLVENELSGTEGTYSWNGLSDNNGKLPMGYYIVLIEAWHPDGNVWSEKKAVLLLPEKK